MEKRLSSLVIIVFAFYLILKSSFYTVNEWERALKFKFGEFSGEMIEPGWHLKLPIANTISKFDIRIQTLDADAEKFVTIKKEEILVDNFVKWKIRDLRQFYKANLGGNFIEAERKLASTVNSSLRDEVAKKTISQVVHDDRVEIMKIVRSKLDKEAEALGIEVVDVRFKRVDLAREILESAYDRMISERQSIATEKRSTGKGEANEIRASADNQRQILLANANKEAQIIRGEGDAQATKIYADAFGQDEEFYALYRSLEAYKNAFDADGDIMVVEPDSEFFKYFKSDK